MSVEWYGKEIEQKLEQAVKAGLTASVIFVQSDAKLRCPVDLGRLRNSITYQISKEKALIGTNVEYAVYVEFGTGIYAEGGKGRKDPSGARGWGSDS